MKRCVKCSGDIEGKFTLCQVCYDGWPKGLTLEAYIGKPVPVEILRLPKSPLLRI